MLALIQKIEAADAAHFAKLHEMTRLDAAARAKALEKKGAHLRLGRTGPARAGGRGRAREGAGGEGGGPAGGTNGSGARGREEGEERGPARHVAVPPCVVGSGGPFTSCPCGSGHRRRDA